MHKQKTKSEIINQFKASEHDTGSAPVQVALITERINYLTEHFKTHAKDFSSKRGLQKLVGQRRSFLDYISRHDPEKYKELLQKLDLRK